MEYGCGAVGCWNANRKAESPFTRVKWCCILFQIDNICKTNFSTLNHHMMTKNNEKKNERKSDFQENISIFNGNWAWIWQNVNANCEYASIPICFYNTLHHCTLCEFINLKCSVNGINNKRINNHIICCLNIFLKN